MAGHVFVSYQRDDGILANALARDLVSEGFDVFIDRHIRVGGSWDDQLDGALQAAHAVVVLWSKCSVISRWVRLEARSGLQRGILCPVLLTDCKIPVEFSDIECANLRNWEPGNLLHPEWCNLIAALRPMKDQTAESDVSQRARLSYEIGMKFLNGNGCPADPAMAASWLKKALLDGHPDAQRFLDEISGVSRNVAD